MRFMKTIRTALGRKGPAILAVGLLLAAWQAVSASGLVPAYMLPAPTDVVRAFWTDAPQLWEHSRITLQEAFYGLALGTAIGFSVFLESVRYIGPVKATLIGCLEPVTATVLSAALFQTRFSWAELLGFGFVLLTVFLSVFQKKH